LLFFWLVTDSTNSLEEHTASIFIVSAYESMLCYNLEYQHQFVPHYVDCFCFSP
jgi:hypothetical protein